MKGFLEVLRAATAVTMFPAIFAFYFASSRTWLIWLGGYVVVATVVLMATNHLLADEKDGDPAEAEKERAGEGRK
jgi:uncharacterized membrane protein